MVLWMAPPEEAPAVVVAVDLSYSMAVTVGVAGGGVLWDVVVLLEKGVLHRNIYL